MTVQDLWAGLSKREIAEKRTRNERRYLRRWRSAEINPATGKRVEHKQSYKEAQKAQAYLDDAQQMATPKAQRVVAASITVGTLLDRHLRAKFDADASPKTVEADLGHAAHVRRAFGDRVVATLEPTEVEIWAKRTGTAASSRKKQLELLRAAVKRGIGDRLIASDPTGTYTVPLGHHEMQYLSSKDLMTVIGAAATDFDRTLLSILGLMGLRSGEARSLTVGALDPLAKTLSVTNSGSGRDRTKTRAGMRKVPVPASVLPGIVTLAGDRPRGVYLFESRRKPGQPVDKGYVTDALTRAIARANVGRSHPIARIKVHELRHTFAAIALSELQADVLSVSRALGHAKPSTTLNEYGHLAHTGLSPLMDRIDELVSTLA